MTAQLIGLVIAIGVAIYFLRKEKRKNDDYFGKIRPHTKKELSQLAYYKERYTPLPADQRFPNLSRDHFELEDIARNGAEVIYQDPLPSLQEISGIRKGDLVKLVFVDKEGDVERMWVQVLEKEGQVFRGYLRNEALNAANLREGALIHFHANHILDTERNKTNG